MAKNETIFCRISTDLKHRLATEAQKRNEAEAVIIREALREYFSGRDAAFQASVFNDKSIPPRK